MDILKSELFYKFRSYIDPTFKNRDFSFYLHKIKKLAPISYALVGEDFLNKTLPDYFKELHHNPEDLTENIYYLPLFYKKYQSQLGLTPSAIELLDYEFARSQIETDPSFAKRPRYNSLKAEVFLNPISQIMRLEFNVHLFATQYLAGKIASDSKPVQEKNLLMISKDSGSNQLSFLYGNKYHAAIIDELHDGKVMKKDLIQKLQIDFPEAAQREWIVALKDLKEHSIIIEA